MASASIRLLGFNLLYLELLKDTQFEPDTLTHSSAEADVLSHSAADTSSEENTYICTCQWYAPWTTPSYMHGPMWGKVGIVSLEFQEVPTPGALQAMQSPIYYSILYCQLAYFLTFAHCVSFKPDY